MAVPIALILGGAKAAAATQLPRIIEDAGERLERGAEKERRRRETEGQEYRVPRSEA